MSRKNSEASELKIKGNEAFAANNFEEAVKHFSGAIKLTPENHLLYSNRSAALAQLQRFQEAWDDGKKCTELMPDWWKGWSRRGYAAFYLGHFADSEAAYARALEAQPADQSLKEGLERAKQAQRGVTAVEMEKMDPEALQRKLKEELMSLPLAELQKQVTELKIPFAPHESKEQLVQKLLDPSSVIIPKSRAASGAVEKKAKKYMTPGEKRLAKRKKLLSKLDRLPEKKLVSRARREGLDLEETLDRDSMIQAILSFETDIAQLEAHSRSWQKVFVYGTTLLILVLMGGLIAFFVANSEAE